MSLQPARKKFKIAQPDYTEFAPGSILKIRLENFVIYKLTEFHLSPGLNMIIGPNGSGKSTFVCAVCLGLAGKPEFIGRAKRIEDFIRNNTDSCKIEITLKNNYEKILEKKNQKLLKFISKKNEVIQIRRVIYKKNAYSSSQGKDNSGNSSANNSSGNSGSKSEYYINNHGCSEQLVKELVSVLNIQLDNLCQFLSQERVEEFAKLKKEKLLIETIRSIQPELVEVFENLQNNEAIRTEKNFNLQNKLKVLNSALEKRQELQEQVKVLQQYHEKIERIELHKKLIPIVKIKDFDVNKKKIKNDLALIKGQYQKLSEEGEPYQEKMKSLNRDYKRLESKNGETNELLEAKREELNRINRKIKEVLKQTDTNRQKIQYYKTRTANCLKNIDDNNNNKQILNEELLKHELPDQSKFDELHEAKKTLILAKDEKSSELDMLHSKRRTLNSNMSKEREVINRKQQSLKSTDTINILDAQRFKPEIKEAVLYMRSHADEVQNTVLPPPVMSVSTTNAHYSHFLNAVVDRNVSQAFTVTSDDAYQRYSSLLLDKYGLNIRQLSSNPIRRPAISSDELKQQWGFDGYLADFVKGESSVIKMLCEQGNIQSIPVSIRNLTPEIVEKLKSYKDSRGNLIFQRVLAGETLYNFRQSKYGDRQIFYTSTTVNTRNTLYQGNVISEEFKQKTLEFIEQRTNILNNYDSEMQEYRNQEREINTEVDSFKADIENIIVKESELKLCAKQHRKIQLQLEKIEENLVQLNNQMKKDVSSKSNEILLENMDLNEKLTEYNGAILNLNLEISEVGSKVAEQQIEMFENRNTFQYMKDDLEDFKKELEEMEKLYNEKSAEYKQYKNNDVVNRWKAEIKKYPQELLTKLKDLSDQYQDNDKFNTESIKEEIETLEDEIKNSDHDDSVTNILENTESKIKEMETEIPLEEKIIAKLDQKMRDDHNNLLPELEKMVENISSRFAKLFTSVGSAGAVELDTPSSYNEWNLKIMVAFRDNDSLKPLDSHTQSGGERAVSTVLFMISLQEFTTAPFRVVDEINQGMDANNERIVHRAMVENACAEKTSQYFLITPKLLTGLHYHPKMRIHCVMAGAWIPNPSEDPEKIHFGQTSNYVF